MRGEFEKGAATRLRIIRTAADLFHKQGVGATSPDEILEASRAGKGQFYHYFGSKEGLVHQVLLSYIEAIESGSGPVDYEIHSWEDLERWFVSHIELQKHYRMLRGCPFGTIGNGVTQKDELARQDLSHLFEIVKNKLRSFFIREKAQGRLTTEADEDRLADFCIAAIQGAMLMGKIKRSALPVEAAVREALMHLRSRMKLPPPENGGSTVGGDRVTRRKPKSRSPRR
jgi:TetR/AcrR family transcriptional regulator, transcriptional repressor for nem operon